MGAEQSTAAADADAAASASASRPLGIAIVGCGQIATHHVEAKASLVEEGRKAAKSGSNSVDSAESGVDVAQPPLLRVLALCDPDATRRRVIKKLCSDTGLTEDADGIPTPEFDSLDDLIAYPKAFDEVDVIFIAVPHDLHVAVGTAALATGRHVVLEKPLAPTLDQCRALQKAADDASGLLIVAEQSPYWEEIVKAKELIEAGKIGRIVSAAAYYYESMRDNQTSGVDADGGLGWRRSLERCGGGIVIDGGLHWIRPLREMCGEIVEVVGTIENAAPGLEMEGETVAHALFKIKRRRSAVVAAVATVKAESEEEGAAAGAEEEEEKANDAAVSTAGEQEEKPEEEEEEEEDKNEKPFVATYSANLMHTAPMAHDTCPYFRITGTMGELVVYGTGLNPDGGGGLRLYDEDHPKGKDLFPSDRKGGFFLGFRGLWRAVAHIIQSGDRDAARQSVRDGAADVAAALALYRSAESGRWEKTCECLDE